MNVISLYKLCIARDPNAGGVQQGTDSLAGHPIQRQPTLHQPYRR